MKHESTTRELEELFDRAEQGEFNSITSKEQVENQNQRHNARKEGIGAVYKHR